MVDHAAGPVPSPPVDIVGLRRRIGPRFRSERNGLCTRYGCRAGDSRAVAVRCRRTNSRTDGHSHPSPTLAYTCGGTHPDANAHPHAVARCHSGAGALSGPEAHRHPGTERRATATASDLRPLRRAYF